MVEEIKISAILIILDDYLDQYNNDLTKEQLNVLKTEITGLKDNVNSAKSNDEIKNASWNFCESISKIKPLSFLNDIDKNKFRGGFLPEPQKDLKIKIINYCVMLQEKIDELHEDML